MYTHTPGNPAPGAYGSGEEEAMAARHLSKAEEQSVVVVGGCPSPSLHQEGKGVWVKGSALSTKRLRNTDSTLLF